MIAAAEEWAASELEAGDDGGLLGVFSSGRDGFELSESCAQSLREAIHEGMCDVLVVLRIINLDVQMATDAYNYANR